MTRPDADLIGFLFNALDDDERRRVEEVIAADPGAARHLEMLRLAVAPLECDREHPEPPAGLAVRAIGFVAEFVAAEEANKPAAPPSDDGWYDPLADVFHEPPSIPMNAPRPAAALSPGEAPTGAASWRRSNVVAAACFALLLAGVTVPTVVSFQRRSEVASCQNNLRGLHASLTGYADANDGRLPMVTGEGDQRNARSFVDTLAKSGHWSGDTRPCPTVTPVAWQPGTSSAMKSLADGYAYPLGYRENGKLHGVRFDPGVPENSYLPVVADRLIPSGEGWVAPHSNQQNVLYSGGNVRYTSTPNVGVNGDPIYTNDLGQVGAGVHRWDTVLGAGDDRP